MVTDAGKPEMLCASVQRNRSVQNRLVFYFYFTKCSIFEVAHTQKQIICATYGIILQNVNVCIMNIINLEEPCG